MVTRILVFMHVFEVLTFSFSGIIYYMVQFSAQQLLLHTEITLTALVFSLLHHLHCDDPYKICMNAFIVHISTLADIYCP